jgi:hypothetical protein
MEDGQKDYYDDESIRHSQDSWGWVPSHVMMCTSMEKDVQLCKLPLPGLACCFLAAFLVNQLLHTGCCTPLSNDSSLVVSAGTCTTVLLQRVNEAAGTTLSQVEVGCMKLPVISKRYCCCAVVAVVCRCGRHRAVIGKPYRYVLAQGLPTPQFWSSSSQATSYAPRTE